MNKGFIQIIIIVAIFIVIISLLGISLSSISKNEMVRKNFAFVSKWVLHIWDNYLKAPALSVWNFFLTYVWETVTNLINKNIDEGKAPASPR